jgi:hypothetical protein
MKLNWDKSKFNLIILGDPDPIAFTFTVTRIEAFVFFLHMVVTKFIGTTYEAE